MIIKGEFLKRLYKNMDKEEIIRVATEDKIRADRNAKLLHKAIEDNRTIVKEKDKEIERLNNIINELETYIIENSFGSPLHNCSVIESYKILDKIKELKGSDKE